MANEFFKSPQLGQAQLTDAQQTGLTGEDRAAVTKAQLASQSIQTLHNMGKNVVHSISGVYQDNIKYKNKVQSKQHHKFFQAEVKQKIANTPNFESIGDEDLKKKYLEYSEEFMEAHRDKPYADTLEKDLALMGDDMLGFMIKTRGAKHTQIVTDATAESANGLGQMFTSGMISDEQFNGRIAELQYDATFGLQDPASSNLPFSDEDRAKYRANITSKQSSKAILKGLLIQAGNPKNSKLAAKMNTPEFRKFMNIDDTNEEYNKSMYLLAKKGRAADKLNYDKGIDGLKETLYTMTNQGLPVNIDKQLDGFKQQGKAISAQDEHKIRKAFKNENDLVIKTSNYLDGMQSGKDILLNETPKVREEHFNRAFSDAVGLTGEVMSLDNIHANVTRDEVTQARLKENLGNGVPLPKNMTRLFDIPAGSDPDKWLKANETIQVMSRLSKESGRSLTNFLSPEVVGKVRAISNIQSNPILSIEQKQEQHNMILDDYSKINSRGYIKPMEGSSIDKDKLAKASSDAKWTTDNLEGSRQNFEIMQHYAYLNERAGMNGDDASELAIQQFNDGHSQHENPDGTEIAIPVEHKNLNPTGLKMFARGNRDISNRITGQKIGGFKDYRIDRQIGMKKAPDFNVSKEYLLTYDGQEVIDARFKYEDYTKYINGLDPKLQRQVNKALNKSRQESIEDGIRLGQKRRKARGSNKAEKFSYGQFDFEFIE